VVAKIQHHPKLERTIRSNGSLSVLDPSSACHLQTWQHCSACSYMFVSEAKWLIDWEDRLIERLVDAPLQCRLSLHGTREIMFGHASAAQHTARHGADRSGGPDLFAFSN
jgi:hypothetical protein